MNSIVKTAVASLALLSLVSCSFSSPTKQDLRIITSDPTATIEVNGEVVGKGDVTMSVKTNESVAIVAKSGIKRGFASVDPTLSKAGIYDIVGGCFLLVPFIGLASDGAWKLEEDTVHINVR